MLSLARALAAVDRQTSRVPGMPAPRRTHCRPCRQVSTPTARAHSCGPTSMPTLQCTCTPRRLTSHRDPGVAGSWRRADSGRRTGRMHL